MCGEADREYESRLVAEPKNLKLLRDLADLYLQKNELDRALGYCEQIQAVDAATTRPCKADCDLKLRKFDNELAKLDATAEATRKRRRSSRPSGSPTRWPNGQQRAERYPTTCKSGSITASCSSRRASSARRSRNFKRRSQSA